MGRKITGRLVYNVGYNSGGEYKTFVNGKKTRTYNLWKNMIKRGYDKNFHLKYPTYTDVEVEKGWHNYQTFAKDIEKIIGYDSIDENGKVYQLDKDLLSKENKIYSKDTVCFLPCAINNFLANNQSNKGELPVGVTLYKRDEKYVAQMYYNKKNKYLGFFTNIEDARAVYVAHRNEYARELAERYKGKIDPRVYEILSNWEEEKWSN